MEVITNFRPSPGRPNDSGNVKFIIHPDLIEKQDIEINDESGNKINTTMYKGTVELLENTLPKKFYFNNDILEFQYVTTDDYILLNSHTFNAPDGLLLLLEELLIGGYRRKRINTRRINTKRRINTRRRNTKRRNTKRRNTRRIRKIRRNTKRRN